MKLPYYMFVLLLLFFSLPVVKAESDSPVAFGVTWSPDGRWIAANTNQGLWLFDTENPAAEATVYFEGQRIGAVEFDMIGAYLVASKEVNREGEEAVSILELETGAVIQELYPEKASAYSFDVTYDLLYSHDGQFLLVGNRGALTIYNTESWEIVSFIDLSFEGDYGYSHWITSITQIGETDSYIVSNWNTDLHLIHPITGVQESYRISEFGDYSFSSAEFLDSNRLLLQSSEGIYIYTIGRDSIELIPRPVEETFVAGYTYSSENHMLIVGGVGIWQAFNVADNQAVLNVRLENEGERIFAFDFNPDGSQFVSLQTDGVISIWDTETGEEIGSLGEFEFAASPKWG